MSFFFDIKSFFFLGKNKPKMSHKFKIHANNNANLYNTTATQNTNIIVIVLSNTAALRIPFSFYKIEGKSSS